MREKFYLNLYDLARENVPQAEQSLQQFARFQNLDWNNETTFTAVKDYFRSIQPFALYFAENELIILNELFNK